MVQVRAIIEGSESAGWGFVSGTSRKLFFYVIFCIFYISFGLFFPFHRLCLESAAALPLFLMLMMRLTVANLYYTLISASNAITS